MTNYFFIAEDIKLAASNPDHPIYQQLASWLTKAWAENTRVVVQDELTDGSISLFNTLEPFELGNYTDVHSFLEHEPTGTLIAEWLGEPLPQYYADVYGNVLFETFAKYVLQTFALDPDDEGGLALSDWDRLMNMEATPYLFSANFLKRPLSDFIQK